MSPRNGAGPLSRPAPGRQPRPGRSAPGRLTRRTMTTMLLTEDQIALAAGLPGPVVAELLQPGFVANELAHEKSPVYLEEDALKMQIAQLMFCYGIRFRYVQLAITTLPDDVDELTRVRDFWSQRVPAPAAWSLMLRDKVGVAVLVLAALLLGLAAGLSLAAV